MTGCEPTDVTGRSFLSYRRTRSDEAKLLIEAQHDVGIPTWQDIRNLDEDHTEEAVRAALQDPETASAVLWLTPEVADSPVIRQVEAPFIVARHERKDGFFCVPVAAGGLDYDAAGEVASVALGTVDLKQWNLRKVTGNPIEPPEAAMVARRVLRRRLAAIHAALPQETPLQLSLDTRVAPAFRQGVALALDWSHRFDGRIASPEAWNHYLLPALESVAATLEEIAPGRRVEARGRLGIPAATALGATFLAPRQLSLGWWQYTTGQEELWSLEAPREGSGFVAVTRPQVIGAEDLAVLVSVVDDIASVFDAALIELSPCRALTIVSRSYGDVPHILGSAGQAVDAAHIVAGAIRQARRDYRITGRTHLFMAVPVGLAVLIGQLLNTLGPVQSYEHAPDDGPGCYRPASLLHPAG